MAFPKAIITKPFLITNAEYQEVGQNIALVGYDEFSQKMQESKGYASPRLLNWVEPYEVGGERKTLFYTEVNSNIQPGDKVFIVNGSYDSNLLIKKDKYKKGSDGYSVLKVDGCKIALDINYTGALPFKDESIDEFIKVYYIDSEETFLAANRQMTTRGGKLDYKFNYAQNNIAFIDKNHGPIEEWGRNGGVYGAPGFFVREENTYLSSGSQTISIKEQWNNISDKLVYLGSFSVALSPTYSNNGRMLIMNGSFNFGGIEFKEGVAYKWNESKNKWEADVEYSAPIISKSNFRSGTFKGDFNTGTYGSLDKKISWTGKGIWNGGTIINSKWEQGVMNSLISIVPTVKAEKDQYGIPFQKPSTSNNAGFGFNYVIGCEMQKSVIQNGNFLKTKFSGNEGTFSVVEEHLTGATQSFDNEVVKAFFESCEFRNIHIKSGEIKNARAFNSRFSNVKALNSYFEQSVLKDSTYVGDGVIKILGYDEWNMSEYRSIASGTYSYINSPNSKVYKFYISRESFDRMKAKDAFFIKGLKIKNAYRDNVLEFFDEKFRISSWNAFYDDLSYGANHTFFDKRGYEISAFLSTPEENAYSISSYEESYVSSGATRLKYRTEVVGPNPKKGYSIDIVVSRHSIFNKSVTMADSSDRFAPIPRDYNYGTEVDTGTASMPNYIGDIVDISGAYVIDADFGSGIIETSDWNSGYHINYSNDVALCGPTSTGRYDMSIVPEDGHIIINTPLDVRFSEKPGEEIINAGDIVFLNSVDYDNRGMVTAVTLMATGSSYSTTNSSTPATLVNTKISSLTMSATGSGYFTELSVPTISRTGSGTGLKLNITASPIGSVLAITYSAPISGGGSYSVNFSSSIDAIPGPIATASFTQIILTDTNGSITGVIGATYTAVGNAPVQSSATGSSLANAIYVSGPTSSMTGLQSGLVVRYYTNTNGSISSLGIESRGINYIKGQVFKVEGGNATFSVTSVSEGEITSYSISEPGEDYIIGDIVDIPKQFDPNSRISGNTASVTITGITASYIDTKGLSLDITAGTGAQQGKIIAITVSNPGLYYSVGEIFTISGGNLDALVRVDSITGSVTRLGDTYKVVDNSVGAIKLSELGTQSTIYGLTGGGIFYTKDAMNRWNYLSKTRIDRSKIKSGIFRRPYITRSLIRDASYSSSDKEFSNMSKIKNMVVSDAIFSSNGNILSSATYLYSSLCGGSDIWNDGIVYRSVLNGMTFSKGTVRTSTWIDGTFNGGTFYASRSFNAQPNAIEKNYLTNSVLLYYMSGDIRVATSATSSAPIYNARFAWYSGTFRGGEFYKSDWDSGTFDGGLFYDSKFYSGTINGGIIGTKNVDAADTRVYDATINNTTVENAYVYADDSSYEGLSSSTILWNNGVFNGGVFGSNNNQILGFTLSTTKYDATIGALPIKDYKLTLATVSVVNPDQITGEFEIDATVTLKHTYIGDLIINLMAPNGKIINLKRKYSGGANDNMVASVFTSDPNAPSIDIWTAPYTGRFKFAGLIGQGVYYNLLDTSIAGPYKTPGNDLPSIKGYRSFIPTSAPPAVNAYDGDRYLIVATSSDPNWTSSVTSFYAASDSLGLINQQNHLFPQTYINSIVEYESSTQRWVFAQDESGRIIDDPKEGDKVTTSSGETLVYYRNRWTKSYHSNTSKISELLNSNKTVSGIWKLLVMDDAGIDIGFVDEFSLSFSYKDSYLIKEYKNTAIWRDGVFNGGQFINLGVWKNGKFNGGKFISTYGWTHSGDYLKRDALEESYTWQNGEFNGGEFGNESKGANSTWYTGEFNGGTFKGRLWNNGVFTYGEFKGGSSESAVGSSIKSDAAHEFISEYRSQNYYGVWRNGTVSDKKDDFITDKKIFTRLERSVKPIVKGRKAAFSNMLWLGGTFNHQAGEMTNSLWLDGRFAQGKMENSAFNPYVLRYRDVREFSKDDSSIWENGTFVNGEFHYSKWIQGKFISGTAVGAIWKNGVASYMNAYNVFWENGTWRNGNWNGSMFDYTGKVEDGFAREILNRGIEWSGTSSCHIWNLFESDTDKTLSMVVSNPSVDSFATDNVDDAGIAPPFFTNPSNGILTISNYSISGTTITFTIGVNKGGATLSNVGIAYTSGQPGNVPSPVVTTNLSGSVVTISTGGTTLYAPTSGNLNVNAGTFTVTVPALGQPALSSALAYNFIAVASNIEAVTTQVLQNIRTTKLLENLGTPTPAPGTPLTTHLPSAGSLTLTTTFTDPNTNAPTADTCGVVYTSDPAIGNNTNAMVIGGGPIQGNAGTISANSFTTTIPYSLLTANTQYWCRTWIENEAGKVYSSVATFTTGAGVPDITFANPGTATSTAALSMGVTNNGSNPLYYGFIIWPATSGNIAAGAKSHGTLSALAAGASSQSISGTTYYYTKAQTTAQGAQLVSVPVPSTLSPNTQYKVVAYAIGGDTTIIKVVPDGTPGTVPSPPSTAGTNYLLTGSIPATVDTIAPDTVTTTSANLKGDLIASGGATVTTKGFVYKKASLPTTSYPAIAAGGAGLTGDANSGIFRMTGATPGAFNATISVLAVSEAYTFKAFAINSAGPAEGPELIFYTEAEAVMSARYNAASPTNSLERVLSATVQAAPGGGSAPIVITGYEISANAGFTTLVSVILPNTRYYIRWKIVNGVLMNGNTNNGPSPVEEAYSLARVETNPVTDITPNSAKANVKIFGSSNALVEKGVVIYTYPSGAKIPIQIATVEFSNSVASKDMTSLSPGTNYACEAYIDAPGNSVPSAIMPSGWNVNTDGVGSVQRTYGSNMNPQEIQTFWTKADISDSTLTYSPGGTITLSGVTITNSGGSTITEYGIIWTIGTNPADPASVTPAASHATTGSFTTTIGPINISHTLSSVPAANSIIKVRAYAINQGGTHLGIIKNVQVPP